MTCDFTCSLTNFLTQTRLYVLPWTGPHRGLRRRDIPRGENTSEERVGAHLYRGGGYPYRKVPVVTSITTRVKFRPFERRLLKTRVTLPLSTVVSVPRTGTVSFSPNVPPWTGVRESRTGTPLPEGNHRSHTSSDDKTLSPGLTPRGTDETPIETEAYKVDPYGGPPPDGGATPLSPAPIFPTTPDPSPELPSPSPEHKESGRDPRPRR